MQVDRLSGLSNGNDGGGEQLMTDRRLPDVPIRFETERLYLRPYQPGDGSWYWATSQKNRAHLLRYESENVIMSLRSEQEAETVVQELAAEWAAGRSFFLGAFDRKTDEFVAQMYIGPVDWHLPEFDIGFFVDRDHEGQGFVTEAVQAVLCFLFDTFRAHRVRLECDDTNVRSRRVAERCGLVLEGHFRENKKNADGTFSGTLCFGLLRREFEAGLRKQR
jgi:ribosomal-protein-alanine N-acetyltransferase